MDLAKLKTRVKSSGGKGARAKPSRAASGARFVLFIGDEGAVLVHMKDNVVLSRQFVPDSSEQSLRDLKQALDEDSGAPVILVMDQLDQTFVQQTLPPVSQFSVPKLIKRRLERDFGVNDIKGYLMLGREEGGRKDWNFLMISVERSPQIAAWLEFLISLPNRFQGIYLLSVETEQIVKRLKQAVRAPKEEESEWTFFVSHNKVGGFRQVILRKGRIIFTRMAQPVGEMTPEVIAGNIEQEMISTIEYMRRLSFTAANGLDIYIIASGAIKEAIDQSKFVARAMHILTPYEVAQHLNIEGATQPTDQFGDVVLAATIGASRQHVLRLTTPEAQKIDALYQAFLYQRLAAAVVGIGLIGYSGSIAWDMYSAYSGKSGMQQKLSVEQQQLDALKKQIAGSHIDVEAVSDLTDLYQELQQQMLSPLPFIAAVQKTIKPPIVINSLQWTLDKQTSPKDPPTATGVLSLQFPGITSVDAFRIVSKKVLDEVQKNFKGYKVFFSKLPPGYSENDKTEITFDNSSNSQPQQGNQSSSAMDVDLTISGKVMADMPAGG